MKRKRLILVCSLAIMLTVSSFVPVPVRAAENKNVNFNDIEQRIETYVAEHKDTTAGMSVAVFSATETIYRNSFGYSDIENKVPVTENTVMEWGSVSKLLVWVSVMQLVEQKVIDLNVDIDNYLPEGFLKNKSFDEPITMLNLMNHNAGFEESFICMATADEKRIISLKEYLETFQPKQVFKPGLICAYSNWSTTLAAYIVEYVTDTPYYAYVKKNIFEPLGMNDTAIRSDLSDNPSVKERRMQLKIYQGLTEITPNMNYIIMYPAGACTSTIGDMQKFAQALLSKETVLFRNSETYQQLFSPSLYFPETDKARNYHGFWLEDHCGIPLIGHGGNTLGCTSHLLLDLENGIGMVIQTNQSSEITYSYLMPEIIFGTYQGSKSNYTGLTKTARTINNGPFKIYSIFSIVGIEPEDFNIHSITTVDELGIDIIAAPYGDFLIIGIKDIIVDIIVLALYLLSIIYCLFNVLRHTIAAVVRKIKKQDKTGEIPLFYPAAIFLILFPVVVIGFMIPTITSNNYWHLLTYKVLFFLIGLSAPLMLLLIISGWNKFKNGKTSYLKTWDVFGIFICMIIAIINIIYWQFGYFWMI